LYVDMDVLLRAPSFWRRQWALEGSRRQIFFDVIFGMVVPLLGLVAAVRLGPEAASSRSLWAREILFAAFVAGSQLICLGLWLVRGCCPSLLAGTLVVGSLASLAVGVLLLPVTLVGLFAWGLGLLGLTPFATAFVFARNSRRALAAAGRRCWLVLSGAGCGLMLAVLIPLLLQRSVLREVERATALVLSPDPVEVARGMKQLRHLRALVDGDRIIRVYEVEKDALRRGRLRELYRQLTGTEIEDHLFALGE
jgi:hypothetical protein